MRSMVAQALLMLALNWVTEDIVVASDASMDHFGLRIAVGISVSNEAIAMTGLTFRGANGRRDSQGGRHGINALHVGSRSRTGDIGVHSGDSQSE